jgi:hypothetical protein
VQPSEDYDTLVKQFKALQRLLESKQNQVTLLNDSVRTLQRECLISQQTVVDLDALRELNQELTNRVLFLETACEELSKGCSKALQSK